MDPLVTSSLIGGAAGIAGGSSSQYRPASKYNKEARYKINEGYDKAIKRFDPYAQAGQNALATYEAGIGEQMPMYGEFNPQSGLPVYSPTAGMPEYENQGRFNFNLENDPVYQFSRDEALRAATRQANATGSGNSGNVLAELTRRAAGEASRYQNEAFNRQLAGSQENFGRGVTEYGIDADRNREMYNRGVTDYGLDTNRANTLYDRELGKYSADVARNQDMYGRNQNYLERLRGLSNTGMQAATNQAGNDIWWGGARAANFQGVGVPVNTSNQYVAESINNAAQGYLQNSLLRDYLNSPTRSGRPPYQG